MYNTNLQRYVQIDLSSSHSADKLCLFTPVDRIQYVFQQENGLQIFTKEIPSGAGMGFENTQEAVIAYNQVMNAINDSSFVSLTCGADNRIFMRKSEIFSLSYNESGSFNLSLYRRFPGDFTGETTITAIVVNHGEDIKPYYDALLKEIVNIQNNQAPG